MFPTTTRYLLLTAALTSAGCSKTAKEYYDAGDRYVEAGKLREASIEYRNAIAQDPRFGDARYKLARTYLKLEEPGRALPELVRAAICCRIASMCRSKPARC